MRNSVDELFLEGTCNVFGVDVCVVLLWSCCPAVVVKTPQTTFPSSSQSTYDMTPDYNKAVKLLQTTRKPTGPRVCFRSDHNTHQHTHCLYNFHKHHPDGRSSSSCHQTVVFHLFFERMIYLNQQKTIYIYRIVEEKDIRKYNIDRERRRKKKVHGSQ